MDSTTLVPPLYPMQKAFEFLRDGERIRVVERDCAHVGTLLVTRQREHNLFGARIQFCTADSGREVAAPFDDGCLVSTGHAGHPIHPLSLDELCRIQATHELDVPYTLAN